MSLARRAALQTRARVVLSKPTSQKRFLATAHDAHHEHEHEHDTSEYPPEPGFLTANWRNFAIATTIGVLAYNYAPAPSEEVYLTRFMDKYKESLDNVFSTNVNHALHSTLMSDDHEFFKKHQKRVARRIPQNSRVDSGSPFGHPVGMTVALDQKY